MLNISGVKIKYEDVLIRLGYWRLSTKIDEKTKNLIEENISAAQKLIRPKVCAAFDDITVKEDEILCKNGFKIKSKDVSKLFKNCFKIYGVAATIGAELEKRRDDYIKDKETFNALIFDAAGSVAAEEAITLANNQLIEFEAKNSNSLTKRYSTGYGDWTIENQKELLSWLGAEKIGITLTESFLMKPEKSVSAVIGVKTAITN